MNVALHIVDNTECLQHLTITVTDEEGYHHLPLAKNSSLYASVLLVDMASKKTDLMIHKEIIYSGPTSALSNFSYVKKCVCIQCNPLNRIPFNCIPRLFKY